MADPQCNKLLQLPTDLIEGFKLIQASTGFGHIAIDINPLKKGDTEIVMQYTISHRYIGNEQACQKVMAEASQRLSNLQSNTVRVHLSQ
jgi:hypothetical protein